MKTIVLILWAALWLGPAPASAADAPTVADVLARFVAAVGGEEALQKVETRRSHGRIVQDLTWTDPNHQETPIVIVADASGEIRYAESTDWAALGRATDSDLNLKLRWLFHPRYALVVQDFFPDLEMKGVQERDGRQVVVLDSPHLEFAYYALYFDLETGLLSHMGYHNEVGSYRSVDGVLYPHRVVFGRKGGHKTYVLD